VQSGVLQQADWSQSCDNPRVQSSVERLLHASSKLAQRLLWQQAHFTAEPGSAAGQPTSCSSSPTLRALNFWCVCKM